MRKCENSLQQTLFNIMVLLCWVGFSSNSKIRGSRSRYNSSSTRGEEFCDVGKVDFLCRVVCECQMFEEHQLVVCKNNKKLLKNNLEQKLLQNAAACLHTSGKTIHLEMQDPIPLVLPWSQITLKKHTIENLNLTLATLSCSCDNAWIFQFYKELDKSALVKDMYWQNYDCPQCQTITSKIIFHFPKHLQPPLHKRCLTSDSKPLNFQYNYVADKCVYPKLEVFPSITNNSEITVSCGLSSSQDSGQHSDFAQHPGCIEGQLASFFQEIIASSTLEPFTSGSRSNCPSRVTYNLTEASVRDSGWLLCTLNSSILPSAVLTRLLIPGPPDILQTLPYRISKKDVRVNFTTASHSPVTYSWFYLAGFVGQSQEIWEILPNATDRFILYRYFGQFLQGWMSEKLVAKFSDPDIKCNGGWYYLEACNEFGCSHSSFSVNSSRPTACASPNDTFLVTRILYYPELNTSAIRKKAENQISALNGDSDHQTTNSNNPVNTKESNMLSAAIYLLSGLILILFVGLCIFLVSFRRFLWRGYGKSMRKDVQGRRNTLSEHFQLDEWKSSDSHQLGFMEENKTYVAWLKNLKENQDINFIHPGEIKVIRQLGEGAFGCVFLVRRCPHLSKISVGPPELEKSNSASLMRFPMVEKYAATGSGVNSGRSRCLSMEICMSTASNSSTTPLLSSNWQTRSPSMAAGTYFLPRPGQTPGSMFMAMKLLKHITPEKLKDLEREASVLTHLDHPNIVQFYGMTIKGNEEFALLFEYMKFGDLVHYLRDHNPDLIGDIDKDDIKPLTYVDLLKISMQVASGLEYLVEKHLVHRDLAARNCLVGESRTVKLSDFGMTRDLYVTDYYKVMDIVKAGRVLEKPDRCPAEIYEKLILGCCKIKPAERTTATQAKETLSDFLERTVGYCALKNDSIDYSNIERKLTDDQQQQACTSSCSDRSEKIDKPSNSQQEQERKQSVTVFNPGLETTTVEVVNEYGKNAETFL